MYYPHHNKGILIHLLRPGYIYDTNSFIHRNALYFASEEVTFIATKYSSSKSYYRNGFSELAIWNPEEIRLLGALTLSHPCVFSPWHYKIIPDLSLKRYLSSKEMFKLCYDTALSLYHCEDTWSPERFNGLDLRAQRYTFHRYENNNQTVQKAIYDNIDPNNGLLIRGLYYFLKSYLLHHTGLSHDFMEETFIDMQISIEAALSIIKKHLILTGNNHPKYDDVYQYIQSKCPIGFTYDEYLKTIYESWIETKHPNSVYGSNWTPSLMGEDVMETWEVITALYRHIILDEEPLISFESLFK